MPAFITILGGLVTVLHIRTALGEGSVNGDANYLQERDDVPAGFSAPPYYPAPNGGWAPNWSAAYAKAAAVVSKMTLAEKVNLTTGTGLLMGRCIGNTGSALRFGSKLVIFLSIVNIQF